MMGGALAMGSVTFDAPHMLPVELGIGKPVMGSVQHRHRSLRQIGEFQLRKMATFADLVRLLNIILNLIIQMHAKTMGIVTGKTREALGNFELVLGTGVFLLDLTELKLFKSLLTKMAAEARKILSAHRVLMGKEGPGERVAIQTAELAMVRILICGRRDEHLFCPPMVGDGLDEMCCVGMTPETKLGICLFPLASKQVDFERLDLCPRCRR